MLSKHAETRFLNICAKYPFTINFKEIDDLDKEVLQRYVRTGENIERIFEHYVCMHKLNHMLGKVLKIPKAINVDIM